MIDSSTKESMNMKSKDALMDKMQRELDHARYQMGKYEREIENLKSQLSSARIIRDNQSLLDSPAASQRGTSPLSPPAHHTPRIPVYKMSDEKENRDGTVLQKSGHVSMTAAELGIQSPAGSAQLAGGVQNWKNAADLTAKLRERIEQMKRADSRRG